jgi:hypothetical protein
MTELATVDEGPRALDVSYWGGVLVFAAQVADAVSDTEFVPGALRGRREAVAATILYGAEVGLTPMQALAGIHIVDGRPAPSAELARAMILRAGHTFHVVEMTGTRARVWGQRKGRPDSERVVVEWSLDMARAAGLLGRQAWQRYPRAMLVARATGDLARLLFPDIVKGLGYIAEDEPDALEAWAPADGDEAPVPAPRKPLQRRRRTPKDTPVVEGPPTVLDPQTGETPEPLPPLREADIAKPRRTLDESEEIATAHAEMLDDELAPPSAPPSVEPPYPTAYIPGDVPLPLDRDEGDELAGVGTESPTDPAPVLPDPEPEAPDDEGATLPPRIGVAPLKAVRAGLRRQLGTVATPEERHALLSAIVGHPVESSADLTRSEGYRVLAFFDELDEGLAGWEYVDPTNLALGMRVLDLRTPPPS